MRKAAIILGMAFFFISGLASAQESYPWMAKRAGDWTLSNDQGQLICTIEFQPVGEFTLTEGRGKAKPKDCPEPYSELSAWWMPDEKTLWLQKGWRTPVQTRDKDNDGIFDGRYGKKKDNIRVRLIQVTGQASGRATTPTVQGPAQSVEAPPAMFHASELLSGEWTITDANGQSVCTLDFQPREIGQTDVSSGGKYSLYGKETCPEPFDRLDLWETPKRHQIFLFNNLLSRATLRARDANRDGIYEGEADGVPYRLVPKERDRVQKFIRFHQQSDRMRLPSNPNAYAGVYIFQALNGDVRAECRIVLEPQRDRDSVGRIETDNDCPDRVRESVRWSRAQGDGVILEARDGSAMIATRVEPFPPVFEMRRHKGPTIDKPGFTEWHLTKVFGPGALDIDGNPRRVPDLAPQNVIGVWRLDTAEQRGCRVHLERTGQVNTDCASFWSNWRVENGELIVRSSTQTVFFRGALSGRDRLTNLNDPREIMYRP